MTPVDTTALSVAVSELRDAVAHILVDCTLASSYCSLKTAHGRAAFVQVMGDIAAEYRSSNQSEEALLAEAVVADFLSDTAGYRKQHFQTGPR